MLGGMEEDTKVGDPPLAELVGLPLWPSFQRGHCKLQAPPVASSWSSFFLVLITWYLFHASVLYFAPLVRVR
jgi:hypothetical protein